jgi:hypothetical protein
MSSTVQTIIGRDYDSRPVDDVSDDTTNRVAVRVDQGDDLIDVECETEEGLVTLRLTQPEVMALLASLTGALVTAARNGTSE